MGSRVISWLRFLRYVKANGTRKTEILYLQEIYHTNIYKNSFDLLSFLEASVSLWDKCSVKDIARPNKCPDPRSTSDLSASSHGVYIQNNCTLTPCTKRYLSTIYTNVILLKRTKYLTGNTNPFNFLSCLLLHLRELY